MSHMKPVLCQPIDNTALLKLVTDDQWVMQQKVDGKRMLVDINDGKVTGYSRKGERTDVPRAVSSALKHALPEGHFVLDGEIMGPMYNVFDLPIAGELIHRTTPYYMRRASLEYLQQSGWWGPVSVLPEAKDTDAKADLLTRVFKAKSEGIIARRITGKYQDGKRSMDIVKWKFTQTIDCVAREGEPGGKQHFNLELFDGSDWIPVGAISALTGDGPRVKPGDVVEVTYMGASSDGRLIQPVKPMLRTDKAPEECLTNQLVYVNREVL